MRKVLARADASVDDLENGTQEGRPEGRLGHNCSGKHAGMLAACRAHGWPLHPYRDPSHPLQRRIAAVVGGEARDRRLRGADLRLDPQRTLPRSSPGRRRGFASAMRARPELVGATRGAPDTDLMRGVDGWIAKGGAEGLFCAAHEDGRGFALKTEDGSYRAIRSAVGVLLGLADFREVPVTNSLGEIVGSISA